MQIGICHIVFSKQKKYGSVAKLWEDFCWDSLYLLPYSGEIYSIRYQCDGFFTGAKPPWYEMKTAEAINLTEIPSPLQDPVDPDPNWTPVWKAAWEGMQRMSKRKGKYGSLTRLKGLQGSPFIMGQRYFTPGTP